MINDSPQPLVSIIVPTYNRRNLLSRTVESILSQSYKNIELVIVDDGSTDNTKDYVEGLNDRRVLYYVHKTNFGQNSALNTGICFSSGKYVGFCDSDDYMTPNYVSKFVEKFEANDEVDAVYCMACHKVDGGFRVNMPFNIEGSVYAETLAQGYLSHMITIMIKRDLIKKIGLFDVRFTSHQDDDFCFSVAKHCKVALIHEALAVQGNDSDERVTSNGLRYAFGFKNLMEKHKNDIIKYAGYDAWVNHGIKLTILLYNAGRHDLAKEALFEALNTFNFIIKSSMPPPVPSIALIVPAREVLRERLVKLMEHL